MFRPHFAFLLLALLAGCNPPPRTADTSADIESVATTPISAPLSTAGDDWPWWRGPTRDGVASPGQKPPLRWSATENVVWKAPVPGRGHASPTIAHDRVFLPTADEQKETRSVLCFDRQSGDLLWKKDVHTGKMDRRGHANTSQASSSIACDGERIFVCFLHDGGVYVTALSLEGEQLWQKRLCDFTTHQGFASSPTIYQSLVIISADHRGGGLVVALDRKSGEVVWQKGRPKIANYMSVALLTVGGREQLLLGGCNLITSFEPASGKKLWEVDGATEECVGSMVTDGENVFVGGGWPKRHTMAVRGDGSAKTVWENTVQNYVPSMLVHDGHLYTVNDEGFAICWNSATGEEAWKERLGGTFYASPILVGTHVYAVNTAGKAFIYETDPAKFKLVAENQLGSEVYSSPIICGSRLYLRVAEKTGGKREEWLYCIGEVSK